MRMGSAGDVLGGWPLKGLLAGLLALSSPFSSLEAQDVARLATECSATDSRLETPCRDGALAAQATHAALGLAAAGGADLPGSTSTLGRRFSGRPRVVLTARGGLARVDLPDVLTTSSAPAGTRSASVPAVGAAVGLGLFEGFAVAPTVAGILSLDLVGTVDHVFMPEGAGYTGSSTGIGVGARIGVFRESFTLPGITLAATRRWMGEVSLGEEAAGDPLQVEVDATVTSLRGTVSKELLGGLGIGAGVGWDRYESDVGLTVPEDAGSGRPRGRAVDGSFRSERVLFFGSGTYTFLILQLSAEGGWARGFDETPAASGAYDPGAGAFFLRLGLRLTI